MRRRFYSRVLGGYPSDIMPCKGGHISFVTPQSAFPARVAELIGRPDLVDDPLLNTRRERSVRWRDFDALVGPYLQAHTREELLRRSDELHLAFAMLPSVADLLADEHLHERGFWIEGPDGESVIGPPLRLPAAPLRAGRPPPTLGSSSIEDLTTEEREA